MADIEMLSVVALPEDLPGEGLVRGQVGTVVETWAPGVFEVEFCDDNGRTYAMVALKTERLMPPTTSRHTKPPEPPLKNLTKTVRLPNWIMNQ